MSHTPAPGRVAESPKYRTLIQSLSEEIDAGKFRPGQRFPSEAELVKRFGVSRITAGRAVRELARSGLVERRAGSGTFVRQADAPKPVFSGAELFGLLIPDFEHTEIFDPMTRGMASAPESQRYPLLWGYPRSTESRGITALNVARDYIRRRVRGVIFAPVEDVANAETNLQILQEFDGAGIPVVLLDRCAAPYPQRTRHDMIGIDNHRAGFAITDHLLHMGSRTPVFLCREPKVSTVEARIAGFRGAVWNRGLVLRENSVERINTVNRETLQRILDRSTPDALVCATDRIAGESMHLLLEMGVRVPGDIRLTGIDDAEFAALLPVPLTTVRQPSREIGEAAMAALVDRIARPYLLPRQILLETELVVRSSCGAKRMPSSEKPRKDSEQVADLGTNGL